MQPSHFSRYNILPFVRTLIAHLCSFFFLFCFFFIIVAVSCFKYTHHKYKPRGPFRLAEHSIKTIIPSFPIRRIKQPNHAMPYNSVSYACLPLSHSYPPNDSLSLSLFLPLFLLLRFTHSAPPAPPLHDNRQRSSHPQGRFLRDIEHDSNRRPCQTQHTR